MIFGAMIITSRCGRIIMFVTTIATSTVFLHNVQDFSHCWEVNNIMHIGNNSYSSLYSFANQLLSVLNFLGSYLKIIIQLSKQEELDRPLDSGIVYSFHLVVALC